MKKIKNFIALFKYYRRKNYDIKDSVRLARQIDLYLFNLDLFERNVLSE